MVAHAIDLDRFAGKRLSVTNEKSVKAGVRIATLSGKRDALGYWNILPSNRYSRPTWPDHAARGRPANKNGWQLSPATTEGDYWFYVTGF